MNEALPQIARAAIAGLGAIPIFATIFCLFSCVIVQLPAHVLDRWEGRLFGWSTILCGCLTFLLWRLTPLSTMVSNGYGWVAIAAAWLGLMCLIALASLAYESSSTASSSPPKAESLPTAKYLTWPLPAAAFSALASGLGAYAGGGSTPRGIAMALMLNPFLWISIYCCYKVGQLRCPHCRRGRPSRKYRNAAVGSPIPCEKCENWFIKPAA
jgi:hypothetical protein